MSYTYQKGVYSRLSLLATWMPNSRIALGDVGVVQDGFLRSITSLKKLGLSGTVRRGAAEADYVFTSDSGVEINSAVGMSLDTNLLATPLRASTSIRFKESGGFVFRANGCSIYEFDNGLQLEAAIISLFRQKKWLPEWCLVDMVVHAKSSTIIISQSSNATLDLEARASALPATAATAEGGLSIKSQGGDVLHFLAKEGLTPLYRLSRIRRSLQEKLLGIAGKTRFGGADESGEFSKDERLFEEVEIDSP